MPDQEHPTCFLRWLNGAISELTNIVEKKEFSTDPNAELRNFEPLRVMLAVGALLLGVILGFH